MASDAGRAQWQWFIAREAEIEMEIQRANVDTRVRLEHERADLRLIMSAYERVATRPSAERFARVSKLSLGGKARGYAVPVEETLRVRLSNLAKQGGKITAVRLAPRLL